MDYRIKAPETKELYNRIKKSAKERNIEFTLTLTDLNNLSFPITCPILGMPLKWHRGKAQDDSFSFDRIDSSKGYSIDNLQVISNLANRCKNNMTEEQLIKFASHYYKEQQ
jgi:hypothetical protein